MKRLDVGPASSVQIAEPKEYDAGPESFDSWAQQIQDRAETRTEVLTDILNAEEIPCWCHGGLNE